jgi:hypothetical protein
VKAITCKLVGRDIIPDAAGLRPRSQQVSDHVVEVLLGSGNVLVPMQERREFGIAVAVVLVGNEGESFEHGFKLLAGIASLVPDFDEIFEVASDLTLVPGEQDRFDVCEILIQRRTSDAGLLCDLRHRHRQQPVPGY